MIPFIGPLVEAVSVYFQMTVADPCVALHEQRQARIRQADSGRIRTRCSDSQVDCRSLATIGQPKRSFLLALFRIRPETITPNVPYVPLRPDQSLTEHYLHSVYFDEFGAAHPRATFGGEHERVGSEPLNITWHH